MCADLRDARAARLCGSTRDAAPRKIGVVVSCVIGRAAAGAHAHPELDGVCGWNEIDELEDILVIGARDEAGEVERRRARSHLFVQEDEGAGATSSTRSVEECFRPGIVLLGHAVAGLRVDAHDASGRSCRSSANLKINPGSRAVLELAHRPLLVRDPNVEPIVLSLVRDGLWWRGAEHEHFPMAGCPAAACGRGGHPISRPTICL